MTGAAIPRATAADYLRQALNVIGAIGQVAAGFVVRGAIGDRSDNLPSIIVPASYAFSIWSVIFLLLAIYAVLQARPSGATDPAHRAIGWWTAAAMLGNAVWTFLFANAVYAPAQLVLFAIAASAIVAFVRLQRGSGRRGATGLERTVTRLGVGLLAGWVTAAAVVGFAATLISLGFDARGAAAEVGGAALLFLGGGIGVGVLLAARTGSLVGQIAYAAAIVWALAAIVVEHGPSSLLVAGSAVVVSALLAAILIVAPGGDRTAAQARSALA